MNLTSKFIKEKAKELGATTCGIGRVELLKDEPLEHNPFSILPKAKTIIGFGIRIPKALYRAMDDETQFYNYTALGVKYIDEVFSEIFLFKIGSLIENAGYDACLQRSIPGFKVKGDKSTNPEVNKTYELEFSSPVEEGKPAPDVIIDEAKAAYVCGLGQKGIHGKIIAPKYGTFLRYVFIITDLELDEYDKPFEDNLCDGCLECVKACPGNAIKENGDIDTWQCSVYYKGAHKSNPFMTDDFLKDNPQRDLILNGEKVFDKQSAIDIKNEMKFLPNTHFGYVPCLCGKKCEIVCRKHLNNGKI